MHRVVVPKRSSAHRFACLALYRALLRQCNKLPTAAPTLIQAKSHIQERFHRYKNLQSPSQTANALKAGYEAFDLLHSASQGNKNDTNLISTILTEAASVRRQKMLAARAELSRRPVKQPSAKKLQKEETLRFQKATARRHPDAIPILSRPHPVVSGRRHVPVLVNARGIPFLRIKKPQPKNLSGVIRSKLEKRWKRIERRERLEIELLFGRDEDYWDALTTGPEPETWAGEVENALTAVKELILKNDTKKLELAKAMWNIVLAERQLAKEEEKKNKNQTSSES